MGRKTSSTQYIQPIDSNGNPVAAAPGTDAVLTGRGVYALAANTQYYFLIGGQDAQVIGAHLQHDAQIVITAAQIEDCDMAPAEVLDYDANTTGGWIPEKPVGGYVGTVGAATAATNGVVNVTGGTRGGAKWHIADTGARRTRVAVLTGGTPGEVRLGVWGKE